MSRVAAFLLISTLLNSLNCVKSAPGDPVYQLFTRRNPTSAQLLELDNLLQLEQSNFNKNLPTKIYAHGWVGNPSAQGWGIRDGYLASEDCNFIAVDWSILANGEYVPVANNNVPIAGSVTGAFIDFLVDYGAAIDSFHLSGFSMGSHVVGIAGSSVKSGRLPRITGLDPAAREFETFNSSYRLDVNDANFVDILHTSLVGIQVAFGDADFYPNGGVLQPCGSNPGCDHGRAVEYFAESITSTVGFRALACTSWDAFQNGTCTGNESVLMGYPTPSGARGSFYLTTNAESPYARG